MNKEYVVEDGFGKMVEQMWLSFKQEQEKTVHPREKDLSKKEELNKKQEIEYLTKLLPIYVKEGDLNSLKNAINKGANYKKSKETGNNLLLLSLEHKKEQIIKYFTETLDFQEFIPTKEHTERKLFFGLLKYGDVGLINFFYKNQKKFINKICKIFSCKNLGEMFEMFDAGADSSFKDKVSFLKFICLNSELRELIINSSFVPNESNTRVGRGLLEVLSNDEDMNKQVLNFYEKYVEKAKEHKDEVMLTMFNNILLGANEEKFLWILKERHQFFKNYESKKAWKAVLNQGESAFFLNSLSNYNLVFDVDKYSNGQPVKSVGKNRYIDELLKSVTLIEALIVLENVSVAMLLFEKSDFFRNNFIENVNSCKNSLKIDNRVISFYGLMNNPKLCKKLLSLVDFNSIEVPDGENLLHLFCKLSDYHRKNEIGFMLSDSNKDWIKQENCLGKTPLEVGRQIAESSKKKGYTQYSEQEFFLTELERRAISVETKRSKPQSKVNKAKNQRFL